MLINKEFSPLSLAGDPVRAPWRILVCLTLLFILAAPALAAPTAKEVQGEVKKAVDASVQAQAKADAWASQRAALASRIRDLKNRAAWLDFQNEQYQAYIDRQEATIRSLTQKAGAAQAVGRELEPYLKEVVARLEAFVAADIPFLQEERAKRIDFLKDSLEDYHLPLSEKLRRVLEALRVEAGYGETVESEETTLDLKGRLTRVTLIRLGRIELYYLSSDGDQVGRWDPVADAWTPLPQHYRSTLRRTLDMAERKRASELLDLPVRGGKP